MNALTDYGYCRVIAWAALTLTNTYPHILNNQLIPIHDQNAFSEELCISLSLVFTTLLEIRDSVIVRWLPNQ